MRTLLFVLIFFFPTSAHALKEAGVNTTNATPARETTEVEAANATYQRKVKAIKTEEKENLETQKEEAIALKDAATAACQTAIDEYEVNWIKVKEAGDAFAALTVANEEEESEQLREAKRQFEHRLKAVQYTAAEPMDLALESGELAAKEFIAAAATTKALDNRIKCLELEIETGTCQTIRYIAAIGIHLDEPPVTRREEVPVSMYFEGCPGYPVTPEYEGKPRAAPETGRIRR